MLTPQLALILCLGVAANARSIVGNTERAVHLTGFTAAGASQTFADENGVADVGKLQAEGNRLIAKYAARRGAKRPMSRAAFKGKRSLSTIPAFLDLGHGRHFDPTESSTYLGSTTPFAISVDAGSEMTIGSVNKARFSAPLATYPVSRKDAVSLETT
ncbi:hypothetical protein RQP46_011004 [Phenoliferia psychrophenolica]